MKALDVESIIGKKYHKLTVAEYVHKTEQGHIFKCSCECGGTKNVNWRDLKNGDTRSCGCSTGESRRRDLSGERFDALIALENTGRKSENSQGFIWKLLCDCGETVYQASSQILSRKKNACDQCLDARRQSREAELKLKATEERNRRIAEGMRPRHGFSETKVYKAWKDARQRCTNPKHKEYCRYGAIGITMSEEFLNNPKAFCEYLGEPEDKSLSLDRIDPNKGYERGNLRWVDAATQTRNQKRQSNNTSGVTGVTRYVAKSGTVLNIAWWNTLDGKTRSKSYNVNTLGEELAFFLACEKRELELMKLNVLGAGYSVHHGK